MKATIEGYTLGNDFGPHGPEGLFTPLELQDELGKQAIMIFA